MDRRHRHAFTRPAAVAHPPSEGWRRCCPCTSPGRDRTGRPSIAHPSLQTRPAHAETRPRFLAGAGFAGYVTGSEALRTRDGASALIRTIASTALPFPLLIRGKVRDVYDLGNALLMVATDRVSAFDVVLPSAVPRKGEVLTLLSAWWFRRTGDVVPNHLLSVDPDRICSLHPELAPHREAWARRSMLVRKLSPYPVECVVRGYVAGSAWKEYRETGTLAGEPLPPGLRESDRLDPPVFSPASKAAEGHDENIPFARMQEMLGEKVAGALRDASLALYARGRDTAAEAGIILADTKFEFGRDDDGTIRVMDEVMTPDSSRFWPADRYAPGRGQPSLDKQPLRDWLEGLVAQGRWDKRPPAPDLPDEVVQETSRRYQDAFRRLTGTTLDDFPLHAGEGQ
ncbi:MAG TPA: phosphoribosylaminoimidazolesuccinocarboxamide synthase [Longimicrobiaceae bacterium]|nr:phosphoribosylaminoimidazolesuccinocarboxamide synthase [Longimicrobiaceae bacterium]